MYAYTKSVLQVTKKGYCVRDIEGLSSIYSGILHCLQIMFMFCLWILWFLFFTFGIFGSKLMVCLFRLVSLVLKLLIIFQPLACLVTWNPNTAISILSSSFTLDDNGLRIFWLGLWSSSCCGAFEFFSCLPLQVYHQHTQWSWKEEVSQFYCSGCHALLTPL